MNSKVAVSSLRLIPLDLDSSAARDLFEAARRASGDWIVDAFTRFERVFVLSSQLTPGLAFVGAQASAQPFDTVPALPIRLSAGGTGLSLVEALTSCVGEGLEILSQMEREGDAKDVGTLKDIRPLLDPDFAAWLGECQPALLDASTRSVDWMTATHLHGGRVTLVPADLCLRRADRRRVLSPHGPLSTGCAAGGTRDEAAARAVLELIERDAVALWWLGGHPGRPVSANGAIAAEAASLLSGLREREAGRVAWLLDITTDVGVPTIAAMSVNHDARQLACGFAARISARDAARAAILEMAQVETAFGLIDLKLAEGGPEALDEADRRHLRRGALDATSCGLLHPKGLPLAWPDGDAHGSTAFEALLPRLEERGVDVWLTDLTRPEYGIATVRAFAPALQPFPSTYRSGRLLSVVAIPGGGNQYAAGVDIM